MNRFQGIAQTAGVNSGSKTNLWYSFNDGLVHWVSIDTELWYYDGTPTEIANQFAWLKADLAAVNRTETPWVIAMGHKVRACASARRRPAEKRRGSWHTRESAGVSLR